MSTANAPNPLQQPTLPTEPEPSQRWYQPIIPSAKWASILFLFYLIGPVIVYAKGTQAYAAGPMWEAEKRWARINGSAFLSLLWYVPLAIFHTPLASFWSSTFITFAEWFHLPFLAWFGGTSLITPLPSSTLLRWLLSFPLAGLLTIFMEMVQPQTTWETKRVLTSDEQREVAAAVAAQEKKKIRAAQKLSTTSTSTAAPPAKKRKPRTPATSKDEKAPRIPKADSLWGSIDWKTVPETHPLKQAARQEAQDLEAKRREKERSRWLAQQQASFPSPMVDSTLASPTKPASPPSASPATPRGKDEYNWDEGEGSIQA